MFKLSIGFLAGFSACLLLILTDGTVFTILDLMGECQDRLTSQEECVFFVLTESELEFLREE